jgi:dihydrofolate reductase
MSKLLYSAAASLDGFIAGVGGDMSWLSEFAGDENPQVAALAAATGALLVGRRTFAGDDPNRGTDSEGAFGGIWHGPSIVLTHDPPPSSEDPDVTFADDLATAVGLARDAAGGRYVNVLGANVARGCLEAGLLDEILVMTVPVLLGDGVRLFEHPGGTRVRLEPIPERRGALSQWFRVQDRAAGAT